MEPSSSSSSSRSQKRPRLDSEDVKEGFITHPTLYFDDGNIILSCGSTLFRVHRSLLSKHSPVFREKLQHNVELDVKPQLLHGCIHVVLDDTAEDIEAVLNVIYEGLRIDIPKLTVENFPLVSSLLRMCTKYRLDRQRIEILQVIQEEWPISLAKHDAKMDAFRTQQAKNARFIFQNGQAIPNPQFNPDNCEEDIIVHPASVIALLRECGVNSSDILTPLFYALSRGTWQFGGPAVGHHLAALSHSDIERFIIGLERLRTDNVANAVECISPALIPHQQICLPRVQVFWSGCVTAPLLKHTIGVRQPIEDWKDVIKLARIDGRMAGHSICAECAKVVVETMGLRRQTLWSTLPAHFELNT